MNKTRCHRIAAVIALPLALLLSGTSVAQQGGDAVEPAIEAPQEEQTTPIERFETWGVRCGKPEGSDVRICEMFQQVTRDNGNKGIMRVSIGYLPGSEKPIAVFRLPLGIHIPPGVQLRIDEDGPGARFPVQVCFSGGCRADLPLEQNLIDAMKAGARATVTVQTPGGKAVGLPMSLQGFTAALERIQP